MQAFLADRLALKACFPLTGEWLQKELECTCHFWVSAVYSCHWIMTHIIIWMTHKSFEWPITPPLYAKSSSSVFKFKPFINLQHTRGSQPATESLTVLFTTVSHFRAGPYFYPTFNIWIGKCFLFILFLCVRGENSSQLVLSSWCMAYKITGVEGNREGVYLRSYRPELYLFYKVN